MFVQMDASYKIVMTPKVAIHYVPFFSDVKILKFRKERIGEYIYFCSLTLFL